jgi:SAM-dependent methyltransferase
VDAAVGLGLPQITILEERKIMVLFIGKILKKILPYKLFSVLKDAFRYLDSFRYLGDRHECPFCGGRFRKFLPSGFNFPVLKEKQVIGGGYRLNGNCPRCFSGDRERLIYQYLKKSKSEIFIRNIKVLHVAPEKNLSSMLKVCPNIDYISADLKSPLADLQMDITDINQDNNTYDVILCSHVLEHIPNDIKAMRELYRVLKQDGFAILQVPISYKIEKTFEDPAIINPKAREKAFGQHNHVRIYGKDYALRLGEAGFTVNIIECTDEFDPSQILKYGLLKDEKIFLCSK